jgi:NitT/TauT family transport system substrate-binding protein
MTPSKNIPLRSPPGAIARESRRIINRHLLPGAALVLAIATLAGAAKPPAPAPRPAPPARRVTFLPHWIPQAQFLGFYAANEKGFFQKRGLDVEILPGGPEHPTAAAIEQGKADLALMWLSTALQCADRGEKLVNLAQLIQESSLLLVSRKSSGIERPADLQQRSIGVFPGDFRILPDTLLHRYGISAEMIAQEHSLSLFLQGGVDATLAMWYNEYHTLLNSGIDPDELNVLHFSRLGLDFPEDGIYCRRGFYESHRRECADFVAASLEGWRWTFDHPQEALDLIMRITTRAHVGTNRAHQKWMLARMNDLLIPGGDSSRLGKLRRDAYQSTAETLIQERIIRSIPRFAEFYPEAQ